MDTEQTERRYDILTEVDAAECGGCGADASAAGPDAGWFIDTEAGDDCDLAIIRCPNCW